MDRVDCVVIGAGVIGLAMARELALAGREVVILEAAGAIGTGTSSRNSEVIHAGLYHQTGTLKARLCLEGKHRLYEYCAERGIAHRRLSKLVVATDPSQRDRLHAIFRQGEANGVDDLVWLSGAEAQALEPALRCLEAFLSPSTGIIDSHGLMLALQGEAEDHGARIAFHSPVIGGRVGPDRLEVMVGGAEPIRLSCQLLVNSAGLQAQTVAARLEGVPAATIPAQFLAKGNYYALSGIRAPFSRLIYPIPVDGGAGVHITLDLAGQARFGPDVEWVDGVDYRVDPRRADAFYQSVRRYWPDLPDHALVPAYCGVRPKLTGPGQPAADFQIQGPAEHGIPGLLNLYGIESPGLTAALAIARIGVEALV